MTLSKLLLQEPDIIVSCSSSSSLAQILELPTTERNLVAIPEGQMVRPRTVE